MKIRSLVLGSVAAAGLSTAGYAADLGVLTSLDVCDSLGLSGLTISSDTNCLQISGGVEYEFKWGDYEGPSDVAAAAAAAPAGTVVVVGPTNSVVMPSNGGYDAFTIATPGFDGADAARNNDWSSKVKAWVQFVGTAASDFGPASVVIKLQQKSYSIVKNEGGPAAGSTATTNSLVGVGSGNSGVVLDRAYVSVGDSTVLTAGKIGTIMNFGDDVPLNFLGLFQSEKVDVGVKWRKDLIPDGGHGIQITSDLGNGVKIGAALENLDGGKAGSASASTTSYTSAAAATAANVANAGTAVGVISYAGDGIAAHLTVAASGFLDGVVENWGYHAGFSGNFDVVKVVAAIAGDNSGYWNGLASASATFDIFTLAASVEAVQEAGATDYGFGISASAAVTDTVSINVGGRWYHDAAGAGDDSYQIAAQLVAAVTETITLTGEVGLYGGVTQATGAGTYGADADVYYGAATAEWKPGGGFTTSLKGEAYSNGAYRATFKAAKTFQ